MIEKLELVLKNNDISGAKAILSNEILWNISSKEDVMKMVEICEKAKVFMEENDIKLEYNRENLTRDYLLDINTELTLNFCKEKFLLAYEVSRYLNEEENSKDINNSEEANKNISKIMFIPSNEEGNMQKERFVLDNRKKNILIGVVATVGIFGLLIIKSKVNNKK